MKFTQLLDEYGIPYETEGRYCRPGWIQMRCFLCGGGSNPDKPYLGYNVRKRYLNCWNCGYHSLVSVVIEITHKRFDEAIKIIDELEYDLSRPEAEFTRGKLWKPSYQIQYPNTVHCLYLMKRGFMPDRIFKLWDVKTIAHHHRLGWRLYIPIHYQGRHVSWTSRTIAEGLEPRYISASPEEEILNHRELLYGEDYCRHGVVVHEGPTDVWRTGPGAVCTFGTGFSQAQVLKLSKYPIRVVCFDNELPAQMRAGNLCRQLMAFPGQTLNVVLSAKDAALASSKEIEELKALIE